MKLFILNVSLVVRILQVAILVAALPNIARFIVTTIGVARKGRFCSFDYAVPADSFTCLAVNPKSSIFKVDIFATQKAI